MSGMRLGIDIGGTFTDLLLLDEETGQLIGRAKVSTTPADPSQGAMNGVTELKDSGAVGRLISFVCHATTIITNALLQHRTARGGLITTKGFRDVLEIARQVKPKLYDVNVDRLPALIPRERIKELSERMLADGSELRPLVMTEVDEAVRQLLADKVECIAVCFVNSYANPEHERMVAARIAELAPHIPVCISTDVVKEYRQHQRLSTAVVNAVTMPAFVGYIERFGETLKAEQIEAPFYLMQSNGGMMRADAARRRPVNFIESGPAAGVIAAAQLCAQAGYTDILSFDMGGTTAKVGLIQGGVPMTTSEYSVGGPTHGRVVGANATGYPIRVPVLDLVEVGTGGGSIAWLDASGGMHVGPESAGADPGPMCYGRGGDKPTVTDAHVVTGVIDPENFLGGHMRLDADRSYRGIEKMARTLGLDPIATAQGIIEIADAAMLGALRVMSVERGVDPRKFVLVGFGGAGPMRAAALGAALGVKSVIIPAEPGLFSTLGLLTTDVKREEVRSVIQDLHRLSIEQLTTIVGELSARADGGLAEEGLPPARRNLSRSLDLRYRGQSYELSVPLADGPVSQETLTRVAADFHEAHRRRYAYANPQGRIQLVGVRISAVGSMSRVRFATTAPGDGNAARAKTGERKVSLDRRGMTNVPVYARERLLPGDLISGPAVLEQFDSTILIQPRQTVSVDTYRNLSIVRAA